MTLVAGLQQFGPNPQRVVKGVPHAEHPLVAPLRAHAATHLVREILQAELVISLRVGAAKCVRESLLPLPLEENLDGLREAPL